VGDKTLLYIIRARNEASKVFKQFRDDLNGVGKEAEKASRTANAALGFFTKEAGQEFKNFGQSILGSVQAMADAGREAERTDKLLNAVLKSTGHAAGLTADEIKDMAAGFQSVTNFSDDAIVSAQNVLLTYTAIGKETFPRATQAVLDMSAALGTDLNQAAERVGNILNYPSVALNSLTKQGFRFTEQQKEQIHAMEAAGNIAGAQAVIFEELELAYGGAAQAVADSSTQMTNSIQGVKDELGKALLPVLDRIAEVLVPILEQVKQWIQDNPELAQTIIAVTAAIGALAFVFGSLLVVVGSVAASLAAIGVTVAAGGAFFIAITGVIALITAVTQHWEGLKWMFGNVWNSIVETLQEKVNIIKSIFTGLFNFLKGMISSIIGAAGEAVTAAKNVVSGGSKRAIGGPAEGLTLVGERGPELVSLPRGSYVHTAGKTRSMLSESGQSPLSFSIGQINVYNEADEDRFIEKIRRAIELQTLQAA